MWIYIVDHILKKNPGRIDQIKINSRNLSYDREREDVESVESTVIFGAWELRVGRLTPLQF